MRNSKYLVVMCVTTFFDCTYRLNAEGQDFFTSYDEVYDSFDAMGLKENLLRGIYAYGQLKIFCRYSFLVLDLCTDYEKEDDVFFLLFALLLT